MDFFGRKKIDKLIENIKQINDQRIAAFMANFNTNIFSSRFLPTQLDKRTRRNCFSGSCAKS
jgi:hypothetical protein